MFMQRPFYGTDGQFKHYRCRGVFRMVPAQRQNFTAGQLSNFSLSALLCMPPRVSRGILAILVVMRCQPVSQHIRDRQHN